MNKRKADDEEIEEYKKIKHSFLFNRELNAL